MDIYKLKLTKLQYEIFRLLCILNKFKIISLPTFIFLNEKGEEFLRLSGIIEKEKLVKIISENRDK